MTLSAVQRHADTERSRKGRIRSGTDVALGERERAARRAPWLPLEVEP